MRKRFHWLARVINTNDFQVIAEVGTATGNTTKYLLENCPKLKKLIAIDMWYRIPSNDQWNRDDMEKIFREKVRNEDKVQIIKQVSWKAADNIMEQSLDLCFIDADHDKFSVTKDSMAWKSKVKSAGMLCGHDYNLPGVKEAVHEIFGDKVKLAGVDNCWFVQGQDLR